MGDCEKSTLNDSTSFSPAKTSIKGENDSLAENPASESDKNQNAREEVKDKITDFTTGNKCNNCNPNITVDNSIHNMDKNVEVEKVCLSNASLASSTSGDECIPTQTFLSEDSYKEAIIMKEDGQNKVSSPISSATEVEAPKAKEEENDVDFSSKCSSSNTDSNAQEEQFGVNLPSKCSKNDTEPQLEEISVKLSPKSSNNCTETKEEENDVDASSGSTCNDDAEEENGSSKNSSSNNDSKAQEEANGSSKRINNDTETNQESQSENSEVCSSKSSNTSSNSDIGSDNEDEASKNESSSSSASSSSKASLSNSGSNNLQDVNISTSNSPASTIPLKLATEGSDQFGINEEDNTKASENFSSRNSKVVAEYDSSSEKGTSLSSWDSEDNNLAKENSDDELVQNSDDHLQENSDDNSEHSSEENNSDQNLVLNSDKKVEKDSSVENSDVDDYIEKLGSSSSTSSSSVEMEDNKKVANVKSKDNEDKKKYSSTLVRSKDEDYAPSDNASEISWKKRKRRKSRRIVRTRVKYNESSSLNDASSDEELVAYNYNSSKLRKRPLTAVTVNSSDSDNKIGVLKKLKRKSSTTNEKLGNSSKRVSKSSDPKFHVKTHAKKSQFRRKPSKQRKIDDYLNKNTRDGRTSRKSNSFNNENGEIEMPRLIPEEPLNSTKQQASDLGNNTSEDLSTQNILEQQYESDQPLSKLLLLKNVRIKNLRDKYKTRIRNKQDVVADVNETAHAAAAAAAEVCTNSLAMKPDNAKNNNGSDIESLNEINDSEEERMMKGNPEFTYPSVDPLSRNCYRCFYCPTIIYGGLGNFRSHRKNHFVRKKFKCSQCTYSSAVQCNLDKHSKCHKYQAQKLQPSSTKLQPDGKVSKLKLLSNSTLKSDPTKQAFLDTTTNFENSSPNKIRRFKCFDSKCGSNYEARRDLERHLKRHSNTPAAGKFQCDICTYRVSTEQLIKSHLRKNHGVVTNRFHLDTNILNPALTSNTKLRLQCSQLNCSAAFWSASALSRHRLTHRNIVNTSNILNGKRLRRRSCRLLSSFSKSSNAENHEENDGPDLRFKDTKSSIVRDNNVNGQYKCPSDKNCPQILHTMYAVGGHARGHLNVDRIFKCELCTYSANREQRFRVHQNSHKMRKENSFQLASFRERDIDKETDVKHNGRRLGPHFNSLGISEKQLKIIRAGNPAFQYETYRIQANGRRVSLNFRCFYCQKSFGALRHWQYHVDRIHGKRLKLGSQNKSKYKCQSCNFLSHDYDKYIFHCSAHSNNDDQNPKLSPVQNTNSFHQKQTKTSSKPRRSHPLKTLNSLDTVQYNLEEQDIVPVKENSSYETIEDQESFNIENTNPCLIEEIKMCNFMSIVEKTIDMRSSNNILVQGEGKTTVVLAMAIGLGYDILINTNTKDQNLTICGVDVNSLVRYGETHGHVEVTFRLVAQENQQFGKYIKIRRILQQGVPLSECGIQLFREIKKIYEPVTKEQVSSILSKLIPVFALRFMILSVENIQFLAEHFSSCEEVFWELAKRKKAGISERVKQRNRMIDIFRKDLESRQLRISFLKNCLVTNSRSVGLRNLRAAQAIDLKSALEQYSEVNDLLTNLVQDVVSIDQADAELSSSDELVNQMRIPFQKFLSTQNHVGDIMLDGKELIVWILNTAQYSNEEMTLDSAKQIWRSLTVGRRKLAVLGLYFAFWEVLDFVPIRIADAYSSTDLEFRIPIKTWPLLVDIIQRQPQQQFIISVSEDVANDLNLE